MMKKWLMSLLALMLAGVCALADGGLKELPDEAAAHIARHYVGYAIEDCAQMPDVQKVGDLALVLVKNSRERRLLMYDVSNGACSLWLETAKAIPQHQNEGWIDVLPEGETFTEMITEQQAVSDGLRFTVGVRDDSGETTEQSAQYHYHDGTFLLEGYSWDIIHNFAAADELLAYRNLSSGESGAAHGVFERDIRYLRFDALPRTLREARDSLSVAPKVPSGRIVASGGVMLSAREVKFTGGRNYPVYLGPGKSYLRSGNGKGSVSTNDWIQVFGRYEDYIMIQYDISADRYRIGWIQADALPRGASVPEIDFSYLKEPDYGEVVVRCELTDDPFGSRTAIATLEPGTPICELVFNMGGWSYIRVTIDGERVCAFVPSDCISHG